MVLRLLTANSIEERIYARALAKRGLERLLLHGKGKSNPSIGCDDNAKLGEPDVRRFEEEIDISELLCQSSATESIVDASKITDEDINLILSRLVNTN